MLTRILLLHCMIIAYFWFQVVRLLDEKNDELERAETLWSESVYDLLESSRECTEPEIESELARQVLTIERIKLIG